MSNGEETDRNAQTESEEQLQKLLEEKEDIERKLEQAKSTQRSTEIELLREKNRTKAAEKVAEDATSRADKCLIQAGEHKSKAEKYKSEAEKHKSKVGDLLTELEEDNAAKTILAAEQKARRGLRSFVQQSLSDILAGVDDAALDARLRQLDRGVKDSGFITAGGVGSIAGRGRDSTVEFDLAVVAGEEQTEGKKKEKKGEVTAKMSFMDVIPLGFSAEARLGVRDEQRSEKRSELTRHNRIRFTVPVTFASLDDPAD